MFNENINFSTEFQYRVSLKKQQFITWYFSLHLILLKMTKNSPLKWHISTAKVPLLFYKVFLGLGPILTTGLKYWLTAKFLQTFFTQDCPMKTKVTQAQNYWFVFKERSFTTKGRTDLHTPDMNKVKWVQKQLRMAILWKFFLPYISLVKVIPETESIQLFGYKSYFLTLFFCILETFTFWKELVCLFYKSLLTFLNFHELQRLFPREFLTTRFLVHISILCLCN